MQRYVVPPTVRDQEKIIGGVLTITQTIFLGIGCVLAFTFAQLFYNVSGQNVIIAIAAGAIAGAPMAALAFLKKHDYGDMPIAQYLIYKFFFNHSKKKFPNINENFRR